MTTREDRLIPGGVPRWIRCYDNGGVDADGGSIDRYTVVFTGRFCKGSGPFGTEWPYLAMSARPFHPQGFGQHGHTWNRAADVPESGWPPAMGRKGICGRRIAFGDLPPDCQEVTISDYRCLWQLCGPECPDCNP